MFSHFVHSNVEWALFTDLQPESTDLPYVVLTTWQDKDSFEAWVGSEDFKLSHSNPMPKEAFDGEGKLEMHEIIIATNS